MCKLRFTYKVKGLPLVKVLLYIIQENSLIAAKDSTEMVPH